MIIYTVQSIMFCFKIISCFSINLFGRSIIFFFILISRSYKIPSMNTFPKPEPSSWVKSFIAPLVAALIAGFGAFVSVQKEMSVVASSVYKMSATVDKLADNQTRFFEAFYLPLAIKVEKQDAEIKETRGSLGILREEIRMFHSNGGKKN